MVTSDKQEPQEPGRDSSLLRQKILDHGCKLFGQTPRFGNRFQLPVNVLDVALLADAHRAHDYNMMLGINPVDDAMISKLVLPITGKRTPQRQAVAFRINGQLLLQDLAKLVSDAPVETFNVRSGIRGISQLKASFGPCPFYNRGRGGRAFLPLRHSPKTSAVLSKRPATTSSSMVLERRSKR